MRIELICFGSELLKDKVNSNICHVARLLAKLGLRLNRSTTVGDDPKEINQSLRESWKRSDILLTTGGLGPTFDDLTRESAAKLLHKPLIYSPTIEKWIQDRFKRADLPMSEENKRQAYFLKGAKVIQNEFGTAPGQIVEQNGRHLILLPGPPQEMIPMMEQSVLPFLKKFSSQTIQSLVLHIFGFPESEVDERIGPIVQKNWNRKGAHVTFGILAHYSIIDVKVDVEGRNRGACQKILKTIERELNSLLGKDIYGSNEETLSFVVGKILKERRETLSVAESCTGGLTTDQLTDVPSSSLYLLEGVVTYSNESKMRNLGVQKETLRKFGAVSESVAKEMAKGILQRSQSDWSLSITGIAGPTGGTKGKPVGTVCFAVTSKNRIYSCTKRFSGTRKEIKEKSALTALDLLRRQLFKR